MIKWFTNKALWYGTASMTFFCTGLFLTIFYHSVLHTILSILFTGITFYLFERLFVKVTTLRLSGVAGIASVFISLTFAILAFVLPQVAFSYISLLMFSIGWILSVGLGLYHVTDNRDRRISVLLLCLGCCFIALIGWHKVGRFNPDSIYYYLISQTIGDDFGHMSLIRQYALNTDYNISFPYLYSLLLFFADEIFGLGITSGILLNCVIFLFTFLLILYASKRFTGKIWPAALMFFAFSTSKSYIQETLATCSIPLCLLISLGCVYLCINNYLFTYQHTTKSASKSETIYEGTPKRLFFKHTLIQIAVIGLLAGCATATRFDALTLLLFVVLSIFTLSKGCRFKNTAVCIAFALIPLLPWIIYCFVHFGSLWMTDNGGTVFLVTPEPPHRVALESDLTLFNAPVAWAGALIKKAVSVLTSMCLCAVPAVVIFVWCTIGCVRHRKLIHKRDLGIAAMILAYLSCKTAMYILVGYPDQRYHIETVLLATFCSIILYVNNNASHQISNSWIKLSKKYVFASIGVMFVLACVSNFNSFKHAITQYRFQPLQSLVEVPAQFYRLDEELTAHSVSKNDALLCIGHDVLTRGPRLSLWFGRRIFTIYSSGAVPTPEKVTTLLNKRPEIEFVSLSKQFPHVEILFRFLEDHYPKDELSDVYLFHVKGTTHDAKK